MQEYKVSLGVYITAEDKEDAKNQIMDYIKDYEEEIEVKATKPKGFTLIELLIVIAIIGLLSTVIVTAVQTVRLKDCAEGSMETCRELKMTPKEAKKKLEEKDVEIEADTSPCYEKHKQCKYSCADSEELMSECVLRCDVKQEKCIDKLNKLKSYD